MLTAFTVVHVLLSLSGIAAGLVVTYGFLTSQSWDGWTRVFLATTAATSATGFFFPFHGITPGIAVGILSLLVLGPFSLALYRYRLVGAWRRTYVITGTVALYFNVFVLVVQLFKNVPALHAVAPTQSEPPFAVAQLSVLLIFVWLGVRAAMKAPHLAVHEPDAPKRSAHSH